MFLSSSANSDMSNGAAIWIIVSMVLAFIGGIVAYILFVKKRNTFIGFLGWLHKFLNFRVLIIEDIIKILYIIIAIFITLASFALIGANVLLFFSLLIFGNLGLRILYEMSILIIKICQNTSEINSKLHK